jgi:phosphonate transport system ATP-binding protein
MRLICEICAERDLPAIVNIHDVALAQMFVAAHRRPARRAARL